MGRRAQARRVRDGLHSTQSQQGSSIWSTRRSWERVICQSECPWPGPLVRLSQLSGKFLQPCVDGGTKPTNPPALMFCAAKAGDSVFYAWVGNRVSWLESPFDSWSSGRLFWITVICFYSMHPQRDNKERDTDKDKNTCNLYVCLYMRLFYFQTDSERNHIRNLIFHLLFSLWPRDKARWAFWQWIGHRRSVFPRNDSSAESKATSPLVMERGRDVRQALQSIYFFH